MSAHSTVTATRIQKPLRVLAWLSFLAEVIIIGTGGAVRLTGSGLGCSEWPLCTPDSLVPTEALGIHGAIEFGNRLMTGLVGGLAVAVLLLVLYAVGKWALLKVGLVYAAGGVLVAAIGFIVARLLNWPYSFVLAISLLTIACIAAAIRVTSLAQQRKDLVLLACLVVIGVVAQGLLGGITVLTELNAFIVGFHYVASLILVCVAAAFLVRMYEPDAPRHAATPKWFRVLTQLTGIPLALTIIFGVLTTGYGPHSGDANVIRDGFDASVMAHLHSWPGYALAVLLALVASVAITHKLRPALWLVTLIVIVMAQIFIGVWQSRTGLPELLVGAHMVLAALAAAAYSVAVLRLSKPKALTD
jgi:cytochrome c oxidase assembly protein subunit 15